MAKHFFPPDVHRPLLFVSAAKHSLPHQEWDALTADGLHSSDTIFCHIGCIGQCAQSASWPPQVLKVVWLCVRKRMIKVIQVVLFIVFSALVGVHALEALLTSRKNTEFDVCPLAISLNASALVFSLRGSRWESPCRSHSLRPGLCLHNGPSFLLLLCSLRSIGVPQARSHTWLTNGMPQLSWLLGAQLSLLRTRAHCLLRCATTPSHMWSVLHLGELRCILLLQCDWWKNRKRRATTPLQ